ncbi:MAG: dNTP triphosphohydrolase [Peptostreptococcaceae bacterium]|nr:dNTP triphosphohydrolase [Peptostreptococcaceae bacterium]
MEWKNLLTQDTQVVREQAPEEFEEQYSISDFEKDYQSIISSSAFRRLQDKTQVFPLDKSDFVRTRLTHSIEVSTLARQLGMMVTQNEFFRRRFAEEFELSKEERPNLLAEIPMVLSCAALLHDIGNPPFGHFGEFAIGNWFEEELESDKFTFRNEKIAERFAKHSYGRQMKSDLIHFEGNAQALRILTKIYNNSASYNINLSYSVINSLVKYPTDSVNYDSKSEDIRLHKFGYFFAEKGIFHEICEKTGTKMHDGFVRHPLAFLVESADDIAYVTADLEDALKKGLFSLDEFIDFYEQELEKIQDKKYKRYSKKLLDLLKCRMRLLSDKSKNGKNNDILENLFHKLRSQMDAESDADEREEFLDNILRELKSKVRADDKRNSESDLILFQKWMEYDVRRWLMYIVSYSFCKPQNAEKIIDGNYKLELFDDTFHQETIKILKKAMKKFVFNDIEILKLELSANKIISALMGDFIYAVIHWDEQQAENKGFEPSKAEQKLINIIPESYKNDYRNAVKKRMDAMKEDEEYDSNEFETEKLYLRFLMVTDFISGMTDSYAKNLYHELNGLE